MTQNLMTAKNLVIKHGCKFALRDLNFTLPSGSVTALLGRNGAGKSSFLDACLGLIPPTKGEIEVLGFHPAKEGPALREHLGYVEADPHFDRGDRVRTILDFSAAIRPRTDMEYRDQLVANLELPLDAKASQLSRGQRTKLALCLALSYRPKLLILDEPFDGLDAGARHEILAEVIHQVDEERGIIIASHDLDEVERIADRVAIIHDGQVSVNGALEDVRSKLRRWVGIAGPKGADELREAGFFVDQRGPEVLVVTLAEDIPDARSITDCESLKPMQQATLEEIFLTCTGETKAEAKK